MVRCGPGNGTPHVGDGDDDGSVWFVAPLALVVATTPQRNAVLVSLSPSTRYTGSPALIAPPTTGSR